MMTTDGTFVINGAERVVVSQLVRSPGVYFDREPDQQSESWSPLCWVGIPNRGVAGVRNIEPRCPVGVKVDRKRKMPVSILLRAIGYETNDQLFALFADVDTNPDRQYIQSTVEKENTSTREEALYRAYRRLRFRAIRRLAKNASTMLENLFSTIAVTDLARVGRFKLNQRLHPEHVGTPQQITSRILTNDDLVEIIRELIRLNNGIGRPDDIDQPGNRRIRAVGELIQMHVRTGFQRLERGIRERMTIIDQETVTPQSLISTTRPVMAAVREFFGGSQLSQFMDQTNPLAELTHKRRLSALGPGGLSRPRGIRCARRAPLPLWPHLPDRNPGRSQHWTHRVAGHLRQDQ
ncbi:MAG: hypothetical protein R2839_08770 [Thermomicrobiales bacterium]